MSGSSRPRIILLLSTVVVSSAWVSTGCKSRSDHGALKSETTNSDADLVRVVDCPPDICGSDPQNKLLAVGEDEGDQTIAMEINNQSSVANYALDKSGETSAGTAGSKTSAALSKSTLLNNLAKTLWHSDNDKSPATQQSLSTLLSSLNPMLNQLSDANKFADNNIDAQDTDTKTKTLLALKNFSAEMAKSQSGNAADTEAKLSNMDVLGGRDGWLNYGDQGRIGAPIPQIVGRIADQRIASQAPGIIAQKQMEYRAQFPFGGFFFGGMIDRKVQEGVMEVAGQQKWQSMNNAAVSFQTEFSKVMMTLGVKSYYLLANDKSANYLDPDPQLTEAQLIAIVESLSGKKFADLVAESEKNGGSTPSLVPPQASAAVADLAKKISLPDGLPLAEIHRLFKASAGFTKSVFPEGLRFKLLADGRLEIRHNTSLPTIKDSNGSSTSSTPSTTPAISSGDFVCTAVTQKLNNVLYLYLYSAVEGAHLSMGTSQGWYEMTMLNTPQPPKWLFVRSGPAGDGWLTTNSIKIRLEQKDGAVKLCQGKVYHL